MEGAGGIWLLPVPSNAQEGQMWHGLVHPLSSGGGILWGGIGSVIIQPSLLIGFVLYVRHQNCHVKGCWRLSKSQDPAVNAPACTKHHSTGHLHGKDPHDVA